MPLNSRADLIALSSRFGQLEALARYERRRLEHFAEEHAFPLIGADVKALRTSVLVSIHDLIGLLATIQQSAGHTN